MAGQVSRRIDRPIAISECGAGASIYQHEENPPSRISQAREPWNPEEWQTRYHEELRSTVVKLCRRFLPFPDPANPPVCLLSKKS
jgi:hypothetical protein